MKKVSKENQKIVIVIHQNPEGNEKKLFYKNADQIVNNKVIHILIAQTYCENKP